MASLCSKLMSSSSWSAATNFTADLAAGFSNFTDTDLQDNDDIELSSSPYSHFSIAELYESLDTAIQEEDYEKAARLRDELDNREDQTMPNV